MEDLTREEKDKIVNLYRYQHRKEVLNIFADFLYKVDLDTLEDTLHNRNLNEFIVKKRNEVVFWDEDKWIVIKDYLSPESFLKIYGGEKDGVEKCFKDTLDNDLKMLLLDYHYQVIKKEDEEKLEEKMEM